MHFRYREVGYGTSFHLLESVRESATSPGPAQLCLNEIAVDVGGACWGVANEERRVLDHHFVGGGLPPSAASAVLLNAARIERWVETLKARGISDIWLVTHQEPDFDGDCARFLARQIIEGEISHERLGKIAAKTNWFLPDLRELEPALRWPILLAAFSAYVDHARPLQCPRHLQLHSVLYAAHARGRPLREAAMEFFSSARQAIEERGLNPLCDALFEDVSQFRPELQLLRNDLDAYQRDVARARRLFVLVDEAGSPFASWFEQVARTPFFQSSGEIAPVHRNPPGFRKTKCEAIFITDPESILFKAWAREDRQNSVAGEGFTFTGVCYSHGLNGSASGGSPRYIFALDPERAGRANLYSLWTRLQEAEFRVGSVRDNLPDSRDDFAGRQVGRDPWYDGNAYAATIVDTPWGGTRLKDSDGERWAGKQPDTVEFIVREHLELAWFHPAREVAIHDIPTDGRDAKVKTTWSLGAPSLPSLNSSALRFASIELAPGVSAQVRSIAGQIGRQLWLVIEEPGVSTVPTDFDERHCLTLSHAIIVWNRRGLVVAWCDELGRAQMNELSSGMEELAAISQETHAFLRAANGRLAGVPERNGGDTSHPTTEHIQSGERLLQKVVRFKLRATRPEAHFFRLFLGATRYDEVIASAHSISLQVATVKVERSTEKSAAEVKQSVAAIQLIQSKVEWVEIFLVAVYSVYLIHYLGNDFHFAHGYVGWSIIIGSGIAATLAAVKLKPWEHGGGAHHADVPDANAHDAKPHDPKAPDGLERVIVAVGGKLTRLVHTWRGFLLCVLLLLAVYLGTGFLFFHTPTSPTALPGNAAH